MNPTNLRRISLDTWTKIIKHRRDLPFEGTLLQELVFWNIHIEDLVREDEDFAEANTRSQSALSLFSINMPTGSDEVTMLNRWCDDYRYCSYDLVSDVVRINRSYMDFVVGDL